MADVSYEALGCSISQASASVMADMIIGKTVGEAMAISEEFLKLMQSRGEAEPDEDVLGDAVAFEGVSKYPARIKCALLGWMAWKDATARALGERAVTVSAGRRRWGQGAVMTENSTELAPGLAETAGAAEMAGRRRPRRQATGRRRGAARRTRTSSEALRDVVDPELGVNVVDLGLVYGVTVESDRSATIDMTLTSAACPLTDVIEDQTRAALDGLVPDFRINWVWLPPWGPEKITEDGREQLRALGFNV